jgi:hypothetical protein
MAITKLKAPFLADPAVKWHLLVEESELRRPWPARPVMLAQDEDLVQHAQDRKAGNESDECDEDPMLCEPEDDLDVGPVPAVSKVMREKAPRVVVVLLGEQDA